MKKKEKRYGLLKGIILLIAIAIILTWLIPNGAFSASEYTTENTLVRVGINDLSWIIYYGIYFSIDKIIFLLAIGGLYGVLSKINAYNKLVEGVANTLAKKKKLSVVILSIIIAILTSLLSQTFAVLVFIPFIISVLSRMKLDKLTILATTFGSMLVGILGATYGTEGVSFLSNYFGTETDKSIIRDTVLIRAGILLIGLVLFNFFTLGHMKKADKKLETAEMFPTEELKDKKKGNRTPLVIVGVVLFVLIILGYVNWSTNFNIDAFTKFHDAVADVKIGDDFAIFTSILGSNMGAFGAWDLFALTALILVFTVILSLCYRVKFNDFVDNYVDGLKRVLKPIACVIAAFALLVVVYMSPYVATIVHKLLSLTDGFNLATMSLSALICNIFHTDLGYTGYILASYLTVEYVDYINPIFIIFTSLYGFVQFFLPTSIVLGVGLTSLDVKYKDWLKHIWKFLVGMLVCLLIIFILMTVI